MTFILPNTGWSIVSPGINSIPLGGSAMMPVVDATTNVVPVNSDLMLSFMINLF